MDTTYAVGDAVLNLGRIVARVVGLHEAGPILRELGTNGRLRGGKWVADTSKLVRLDDAAVQAHGVALAPARQARPAQVALRCNECGRKFKRSPNACDIECPKCGGVDYEVML